jgi:hypothetical protein
VRIRRNSLLNVRYRAEIAVLEATQLTGYPEGQLPTPDCARRD